MGFKLFPKRCKNKWDQVLIQSKASISILLRSKAVHISAYFALKTPFLWRHNCFWIVNRNVSLLGLHCVHCSHILSGKSERIPFVFLINHLQCRRGIHSLNITYTNPEQQGKTGSTNYNCLFSHFNICVCYLFEKKYSFAFVELFICRVFDTIVSDFGWHLQLSRIQNRSLHRHVRTKEFHNVPAFLRLPKSSQCLL